jgi:[ribosomal protein S5]-alanine N-acetyltransferase
MTIASERLDLIPLAAEVMALVELRDVDGVQRALGVEVEPAVLMALPPDKQLSKRARDPEQRPWLSRFIVVRSTGRVVGNVGFHGPPDKSGRVEVGYEILPSDRRRGYAREALLVLTKWAYTTGAAQVCTAHIDRDNVASVAVMRSLGFAQVDERVSDRGSATWVFERTLQQLHGSGHR